MHLIYRKEETEKANNQMAMPEPEVKRPLWKNGLYFAAMVAILVFANWARSGDVRAVFLCCPGGLTAYNVEGTLLNTGTEDVKILDTQGQTITIPREQLQGMEEVTRTSLYERIYHSKWSLVALLFAGFAAMIYFWFTKAESSNGSAPHGAMAN